MARPASRGGSTAARFAEARFDADRAVAPPVVRFLAPGMTDGRARGVPRAPRRHRVGAARTGSAVHVRSVHERAAPGRRAAWNLFHTPAKAGDARAAAMVVAGHLAWLASADPGTLTREQREARETVLTLLADD